MDSAIGESDAMQELPKSSSCFLQNKSYFLPRLMDKKVFDWKKGEEEVFLNKSPSLHEKIVAAMGMFKMSRINLNRRSTVKEEQFSNMSPSSGAQVFGRNKRENEVFLNKSAALDAEIATQGHRVRSNIQELLLKSLRLLTFTLALFVMVSSVAADNGAGCPTSCTCTMIVSSVDSISAKCSYLGLSDIPATLQANALPSLDLSYNKISILRDASFSNYSRLSTLTLSYNEIEEIEINTFAGLPMLRDLDLQYNNLKSFNMKLFSANPVLKKVSLRGNPIAFLSSDSPILKSASVSVLDLSFCSLTTVHPITFSQLPSLYSLDLSSNLLQTVSITAFEYLPKLKILKLNNNRWTCNCNVLELMQWVTLTRKQAPAHRPVKCLEGQTYRKFWTRAGGTQACSVNTTTEKLVGSEDEFTTDKIVDLHTVSVGIHQSLEPVPLKTTQRDAERVVTREDKLKTASENKTGGWASLLSWNVNTLTVFVILPITLGVAVFVSLIAVHYTVKRGNDHRTQHDIQEKYNPFAACFSKMPLLKNHLTADITKQHAGHENRGSYGVGGTEYHVYERID